MGEIKVGIKLQGLTTAGKLIGERAAKSSALVDTGASKTIVSEAVAKAANIKPLGLKGGVAGVMGAGEVETGLAVVMAEGCKPQPLVVGISDKVAKAAGADVLLGHDYMQATRMTADPAARKATCGGAAKPAPAKRASAKAPARRAASARSSRKR